MPKFKIDIQASFFRKNRAKIKAQKTKVGVAPQNKHPEKRRYIRPQNRAGYKTPPQGHIAGENKTPPQGQGIRGGGYTERPHAQGVQ